MNPCLASASPPPTQQLVPVTAGQASVYILTTLHYATLYQLQSIINVPYLQEERRWKIRGGDEVDEGTCQRNYQTSKRGRQQTVGRISGLAADGTSVCVPLFNKRPHSETIWTQ